MKVFISMPMGNMTTQEFAKAWSEAVDEVKIKVPGAEIVDSYCEDLEEDAAARIAKNMTLIAGCQKAYFADGWKKCPNCKLEKQAAETFGLKVIRE